MTLFQKIVFPALLLSTLAGCGTASQASTAPVAPPAAHVLPKGDDIAGLKAMGFRYSEDMKSSNWADLNKIITGPGVPMMISYENMMGGLLSASAQSQNSSTYLYTVSEDGSTGYLTTDHNTSTAKWVDGQWKAYVSQDSVK